MLYVDKKVGKKTTMTWTCPAFDHGVSIFPDGKIRPCCQVSADYSKPISEINNPDRFEDLKNSDNPSACQVCTRREESGQRSYRHFFISKFKPNQPGLQFVDFRHSNQCNLKCRYCGPHFSNQWARELGYEQTLKTSLIEPYYEILLTDSLRDLYWCGGEPLIIKEHYDVLMRLIDQGLSHNIELRYNTNLTVIQYKDVDLVDLWKKFKSVSLAVSLDAAGPELNHIRSGSEWTDVDHNIDQLLQYRSTTPNLSITFAPTVSLLNVWFLPELYDYAQSKKIPINLNILYGPDYLSLSALCNNELKDLAKQKIEQIKQFITPGQFNELSQLINNVDNVYLFDHAVRHILLLDNVRKEKLFDILPFKKAALEMTTKNREYE